MRLALIALCLSPAMASAAELLQISVERDGRRYTMVSETWFDAPVIGVFDVLTDYANFDRISSVYKQSGYIEPADDNTPRVYSRARGCVLFFCQTIERVERLENEGLARLRAIAEPDKSDFKFSEASWEFREQDNGTWVRYSVTMEPGFWVPPVIGPYMMKRKLASGGEDAINRIEVLAQQSTATAKVLGARGLKGFEADND
ncbi:MAG: SRPBCC family protein [Pseudomonadota bacterium]